MSNNPEQLQQIVDKVSQNLSGAITHEDDSYGDRVLTVARERTHDVLAALKTEGFDLLLDIAGVDLQKIEHSDRFMLTYILAATKADLRVRVKVFVPEDDMKVATVSDLWESANWAEREAYDFFGFDFEGHPNLERILTHREFEGHALRKDYPLMKGQWATTGSDLMVDLERE